MSRLVLALVACVLSAAAWTVAQSVFKVPEPFHIVSGDAIGFRVERMDGPRAVGRLVIRVDGKWIETQAAGGVVPAQGK